MSKMKKKSTILVILMVITVLTLYVISPESKIITDLPFGASVVPMIPLVTIFIMTVLIIDIILPVTINIDTSEEALAKTANGDAVGAGLVYIGTSIRYLGVALIFYSVVTYLS